MSVAGDRSGTRFGPYELRRLIGRGGMGEVYEAYDTTKDRVVALKLLPSALADDADFRERFRREARTAARLQDPHVIPIHDFGEIDGVLFIDMRLVEGADLKSMIRSGPVSPAVAVALITQVASALDAAHRGGLVHRDVKPENVLVTPDQFAYLADFGIASAGEDTRLTGTGSAIGSIAYMGPERFQDAPVTGSVDIYALTCLLYELLTGTVPYPRQQVSAQISAHLNDPPPTVSNRVPGLGPAMDAVIARGLAKDPSRRFATASDLARAAAAALAGGARADAATLLHRSAEAAGAGIPTAAATSPAAYSWSGAGTTGPTSGSVPMQGSATGPGASTTSTSNRSTRAAWTVALVAAALALLAVGGLVIPKLLNSETAAGGPTGQTGVQPQATSNGTDGSAPGSSPTTPSSAPSSESSGSSGSTDPSTASTSAESSSETTSSSSSSTEPSSSSDPSTSTSAPGLSGNGFDRQGWLHDTKARCNADDSALTVARTSVTYMVICRVGNAGGTYYRGYRTTTGRDTEIPHPVRSGDGWVVSKDGYTYDISSSGLVIRQGGAQVLDEPMEQYAQ